MPAHKDSAGTLHIGFLTALESSDRGYVGGLLVTDRFGRPLEFQCTTPVRPNRTQELLYGPTLVPFIYSDLLGVTLLKKVGVRPDLVVTNCDAMLDLRNHVDIPVVVRCSDSVDSDAGRLVEIGKDRFVVHADHLDDRDTVRKLTDMLSREADLSEPLERVSEALGETMSTVAKRPRVA